MDVSQPHLDEHNVLVYTKWQLSEFAKNPHLAPGVLVELDTQVLDRLDRLFYTSSTIQTVFQITTDALLAGGILFQENGKFLAEDVNRQLQDIWSHWIRDMVASLYTYGFALCVIEPHAVFKGVPRVLTIRDLRIRMHRNVYGQYFFAAYPRSNDNRGSMSVFRNAAGSISGKEAIAFSGGMDGLGLPIEGMVAFAESAYAPTSNGELRSKLLSIVPAIDRFDQIERHNMDAIRLAANPFLAVETKEATVDPRQAQMATTRLQDRIGEATDSNAMSTRQIPVSEIQNALNQDQQRPQRQQLSVGPDGSARVQLQSGAAVLHQTQHGFGIADLSTRQQAGTLITAQNVKEIGDYRASTEEQIGSLFGVPRSMFAQASRGKTSSNDESNSNVFSKNQAALKQKLMPFITQMYTGIYFGKQKEKEKEKETKDEDKDDDHEDDDDHEQDKTEDGTDNDSTEKEKDTSAIATTFTDNLGDSSNDEVTDRTETDTDTPKVTVCLPAIPSFEIRNQWYQEGTLQFESYKRLLSVEHGIPMEWFNDVPAMTLQEMNGIKEQQGSTTTKSESKTSNSKTGAAKQKGQTVTKTAQAQTGVGSKYDQMQKKRNKPLSKSKGASKPGGTIGKKRKKRQRVS